MTVSDVLVWRTGSFFWSVDGDAAAVDHVSDVLARTHRYPSGVRAAQRAAYAD
jgi:glycerol-3-phosphate dehydrogenase